MTMPIKSSQDITILYEDSDIIVKDWHVCEYAVTELAMHEFTAQRGDKTPDEIWIVEHPAVFTQGRAGKPEHLLYPSDIPVVQTDRGGQITYHGLGQLVVYPLINLKRRKLNVRQFVTLLEQVTIQTLQHFGISAYARVDAPGVYVQKNGEDRLSLAEQKIASLGLRVSKGCTMHGLAINVHMDLRPFEQINPCGLLGMTMAQMQEFKSNIQLSEVKMVLQKQLLTILNSSISLQIDQL